MWCKLSTICTKQIKKEKETLTSKGSVKPGLQRINLAFLVPYTWWALKLLCIQYRPFQIQYYFQDERCTSVVSMEFPSFFKCLEFVRCTSNSATLLMLTDANGDDTGALNKVFRVGRNASSTSSWFVLDGTVHNRSNKYN